jgi:GTPase SAR1 family protein
LGNTGDRIKTKFKNEKPMNRKVAFTGSSGSGKTTLVTYVAEKLKLKHISGSAGDVKTEGDKMWLDEIARYPGGGHHGVIAFSALNPQYGWINQKMLQMRRRQIIMENDNFVTDRSPIDNLTYMINQVAYHPEITNEMCLEFANDCMQAWEELTHVVYVKAVQPNEVERNGSRISNNWYQKSVDAQFEYWLDNWFVAKSVSGPTILTIDYWDLEKRKKDVIKFLK